jgi:hypothetical protein
LIRPLDRAQRFPEAVFLRVAMECLLGEENVWSPVLEYRLKTAITFDLTVGSRSDTTKRLMSSPKCRSVEVINNPARPGSNHREVNCINYKQK